MNLNQVKCVRNRQFNDEDVNGLAKSIGNVGLLQPLVLREIPNDENGCCFEVLAGRRRYEALMKLQRYELDPDDYRIITSDEPELISFVENYERKNLSLQEEIEHLAELRETYSPGELASILGRTEKYIRSRLRLRNLTDKFLEAMINNKYQMLSLGHYEIISKYPATVQTQLFDSWILRNPGSIKRFEDYMIETYSLFLTTAKFDTAECLSCMKRSLAEPWLFENLKDPSADRCLDRECFERKQQKAIKSELKKNKKLTAVSTSYGQLPAGLEKIDHLVRNQYDIVESDVPAEQANAYIVDGPGRGTYCRITAKDEAASAGAPRPKTIEDKREELNKRRIKAALIKLSEYLKDEKNLPQRPSPDMLLKLVALNGMSALYDLGGIEKRNNIKFDKVTSEVWDYLVSDFAGQIKNETNNTLPYINANHAQVICDICGLNWNVFVKEATAEIPEPKSWQE